MKKTIKIETIKEVEVELPLYFKLENSASFFAIMSESMSVHSYGNESIATSNYPEFLLKFIDYPDYKEITKEEFKTEYLKQVLSITSKLG
jgi:hypothetical protein